MDKIIDIITGNFDTYTKSLQSVAGYILENYDESAFMNLEQLAASAGVSTTTVIRFARELGFSGYSQMQRTLRSELKTKVSLPERLDKSRDIPDDDLLRKSMETDLNNIEQTFKANELSALLSAVDAVHDAGNMYIIGMRRSYSLAYYAFSCFGQIRKNVHIVNASGLNYPEEIINIGSGDLCLIYLFPRYSRTTLSIVAQLKSAGAKLLIITGLNNAALKNQADIMLSCETGSISAKSSYAAPLSLTNYLTACYTHRYKEESMEMLRKTEQLLSSGMLLG